MKTGAIVLLLIMGLLGCKMNKERKNERSNPTIEHVYWINSARVDCQGVTPQTCYLVKKAANVEDGEWTYFYSQIEGFDFEPGNIYKLLVNEEQLPPEMAPADASSIKYTLVKVLEKTADERLRINDIWALTHVSGELINSDKLNTPTLEIKVAEMRAFGTDGCNNYFGGIKTLNAKELKFAALAGTKKMCMNMQLPNAFNVAISNTSFYKIESLKLTLLDAENKEILSFKKVD